MGQSLLIEGTAVLWPGRIQAHDHCHHFGRAITRKSNLTCPLRAKMVELESVGESLEDIFQGILC